MCFELQKESIRNWYYYMNKEHWNSIYLEGDIPETIVQAMIKESYQLILQSIKQGSAKKYCEDIKMIESRCGLLCSARAFGWHFRFALCLLCNRFFMHHEKLNQVKSCSKAFGHSKNNLNPALKFNKFCSPINTAARVVKMTSKSLIQVNILKIA